MTESETNQITGSEKQRAKILRGVGWTVIGYGTQQFIRLFSNVILTRLLFPEAFGLMTIAQVFLQGLVMLSDIGVGAFIIQNKRGEDKEFLSTAWTLQIVRGFLLFIIMCLLAYPVSLVYHQPLLFPVLILLGGTAIVQGLQSIGFAVATRQVRLGKLTVVDIVAQIVGLVVMVTWAWLTSSVWALVAGGISTAFIKLAMGHIMLPSAANKIRFDRTAAKEIFRFGRWVFVATAFTFFGGEGLKLVQGTLVPLDVLGVLTIAGTLAWATGQLVLKIGGSVLFPVLSDIHRSRPDELRIKLKEARTKLYWFSSPIFIFLIVFGREIVHILYDSRYQDAGTFLVLLATGSAIAAQRTPFGMVLLATGDSFGPALINVVTTIVRVCALFLGFSVNGIIGMLVADIIAQAIIYPFEAWRLNRINVWFPLFDLIVFCFFVFAGALSFLYGPIVF